MSIIVATIPHESIEAMLPFLLPFIERARSRGCDIPAERMIKAVIDRDALLWVASEDHRPLGVAITAMVEAPEPDKRALHVTVAGGFIGRKWINELRRVLRSFCEAEGSRLMTWRGRRGWARFLKLAPIGFSEGLWIFEDRW